MGKAKRSILALFIGLALLSAASVKASAAEVRTETPIVEIRVGICTQRGDEEFYNKDMQYGYLTDYLSRLSYYCEISKGFRVDFQYVMAGNIEELMGFLREGKVDIIQVMIHEDDDGKKEGISPEDTDALTLSKYPAGDALYSLCTLKDNAQLFYEADGQLEGQSIGALKNGGGIKLLEDYSEARGFTCRLKTYQSLSQMQDALDAGEIAAAVIAVGDNHMRRVIGRLGKIQMYLASEKGREAGTSDNSGMIELIDSLQDTLYTYEPYYNSKLSQQYFPARKELYEAFTVEEAEYIAQSDGLKVAVCVNDAPNVIYDRKTGELGGTYIELLNRMADYSGLTFVYVPVESQDEALPMLREGKVDLAAGLYGLKNLAESWSLSYSEPIMTKYIAVISEKGNAPQEGETQSVGIVMDRSEEWIAYIKEYFPEWDERFYTSEKKCFRAVADGTVNFALIDGNSIQADRLYTRYKDVNTISTLTHQVDIVLGFPQDLPMTLQHIINKSVLSLSSSEVISSQMNNAMDYRTDFLELLRQNLPYLIAFGMIVAAAFITLFVISWHRKRYADQKSAFFSNMSHEIRTPLNGVIGMTVIAKENIDNKERLEDCLNKITNSCGHLLTIVNDILDLSKLEKHKMKIASERFDLSAMLHSLHQIYCVQAEGKGVDYDTMAVDVKEELLLGDYTRISQVLMNLLSNAVKFTPAGGRVRLSVIQLESGEQNRFLFSVRDEGLGIPKENLARIFNAYEQQGAKTAGKYGGSGLGLPISRELVKLMGGSLEVESELEKGSNFYFSLLLSAAEDTEEQRQDAEPAPAGETAAVFENDREIRKALEGILQEAGLTLVEDAQDHAGGSLSYCLNYCFINRDACTVEQTDRMRELRAAGTKIIGYGKTAQDGEDEKETDAYLEKPILKSDVKKLLKKIRTGRLHELPEPKQTGTPQFPERRILIAEDNEINMEILYELVSAAGCSISQAVNGREAVRMFAESPPGSIDLIFMDIQMPELNGYEAAQAIRSMDRWDARSVVIVAMTADAFDSDVERARSAGMNRHLSKPVNVPKLYETMSEFLE